ncbi:MAG: NifB/NifX family molybdenum-iron cluster-binding protein [Paludibacter sp.]|nr:NifB/NifX family molybdenum-iron cluster-binding protein [Paludibacter sp.]
MKIAIASEGNSINDKMDSRFGRCAFFAIYDTDTKDTRFLPNPGKNASGGAGPATVRFVAQQGAQKIVATELGGKALDMLNNLNIELIYDKDKTISEIISKF